MRRYIGVGLCCLLTAVLLLSGCREQQATGAGSALLASLASKHRNATNIALWTLRKNGFSLPKIDFTKPYHEARPKLEALIAQLKGLRPSKRAALDSSFRHHLNIYSPFWWGGGKGWRD